MKRYAMILNNVVIDIVYSGEVPVYPPDIDGNQVIAMECEANVQIGDKVVDGVIIGTYVPPIPEPTNSDLMVEIKKNQQDIIDAYTLELVEGGII